MINQFKITLQNIQHINSLVYNIDLSTDNLHCLVGKNSVGKTTLLKAIQNFKDTSTLDKLSRLNIIDENSEIIYEINDFSYKFKPFVDGARYILDTDDFLSIDVQDQLHIELSIPNDKRTKNYRKLQEDYKSNKAGSDAYKIQSYFAIKDYSDKPKKLIDILNKIYNTDRFNNIEQILIGTEIYFIQDFGDYYLREDDFSSGEYMLTQLYKLIKRGYTFIVIDELEISLDSSVQVKFIEILSGLCKEFKVNILFTTHSLAIMKKIDKMNEKLYYMENNDGRAIIEHRSYNFIKAELFQFSGYDRIILTEDKMLKEYLKYILREEQIFNIYSIIACGGEGETIKIRDTNDKNHIFGTDQVKIILDNDMSRRDKYKQKEYIDFIPFDDIEVECLELYKEKIIQNHDEIDEKIKKIPDEKNRAKCVVRNILSKHIKTQEELFLLLNEKKEKNVKEFKNILLDFLN